MPIDLISQVEFATEKHKPMIDYRLCLLLDLFNGVREQPAEEGCGARPVGEACGQVLCLAFAKSLSYLGDGAAGECALEIVIGQSAAVRMIGKSPKGTRSSATGSQSGFACDLPEREALKFVP